MAKKFGEVKVGEKFVCNLSEMMYEKTSESDAVCIQPGSFKGQPDEFEAADPVRPLVQSIA